MNVAVAIHEVQADELIVATEAGPAPKRIVVSYGFWIFLLSDIVMFAALFAAYAVLVNANAGGPKGAQLFSQASVAIETACLLASSYTCGMMSLAIGSRHRPGTYLLAAITFVLGVALVDRLELLTSMVSFGALIGFFMLHLSVIVYFRKDQNRFRHLALPAIGLVIIAYVLWNAEANAKIAGLCWMAAGVVVFLVMRRRSIGELC